MFLARVRLFEAPAVTRFFYVRHGDRYVGVLTTVRLDNRDGYLLNHILASPDAPVGTSELLIAHAIETLGVEGCGVATFGPAPSDELGNVLNLSSFSERVARRIYRLCGEKLHLDARTRFRRKFQALSESASYLVFDPPRISRARSAGC